MSLRRSLPDSEGELPEEDELDSDWRGRERVGRSRRAPRRPDIRRGWRLPCPAPQEGRIQKLVRRASCVLSGNAKIAAVCRAIGPGEAPPLAAVATWSHVAGATGTSI